MRPAAAVGGVPPARPATPVLPVAPGSTGVVPPSRLAVTVTGVVQGVGFRPYVYALAGELGLSGRVRNTGDGVLVEVQGGAADLAAFVRRLRAGPPPPARVESVRWEPLPARPESGFTIEASTGHGGRTLVPADLATCDACLAELADPADRRHRHPFISCTACGPRFTVVTGLPYDRPSTTMAGFGMCADCAREYADPADRRFHAQPIACHACGPVLDLVHRPGGPDGACSSPPTPLRREEALAEARRLLAAGAVVAVKGLGGYHLACDATDPAALRRLRARKRRGDKPFAVLAPDVATVRGICRVGPVEEELLVSSRRPIVLLRRLREAGAGGDHAPHREVAGEVAPGNPDLGVMLPPTALHHLLLGMPGDPPGPRLLVLTSGNLSGEPIVTDDAEALHRLAGIADAWLRHDRPIHVPCDDSVTRVVDGAELPVRRSRGYAPHPVRLPFEVEPVLAVGGDLKNTFAVGDGRYAWLSGHVGDMADLATQRAFDRAVTHLCDLVSVRPRHLVADLHPGYRSGRWAERRAEPRATGRLTVARVQHHHAHVAAVMAEHGLDGTDPVVGLAFDGTGYGTDGAVWGGEVLLADYAGFRRVAHLGYVPLPGGDAAVRRPYRMALAHLRSAGVAWDERLPCVAACPPPERAVLARQLETGLACTPTSSAGRLFDAVASLAGLRHEVDFEAQAATALEAAAVGSVDRERGAYPLPLVPPGAGAGGDAGGETGAAPAVLDCGPLIRAAASDVLDGAPPGVVAARFHRGLAAGAVAAARHARASTGAGTVALSGGVFCNATLLGLVTAGLRDFTVLTHHSVPCTDGGLALGQLAVAARRRTGPGAEPGRPDPREG